MEDAADLIETNLILLGATAIEDKLQDKVKQGNRLPFMNQRPFG